MLNGCCSAVALHQKPMCQLLLPALHIPLLTLPASLWPPSMCASKELGKAKSCRPALDLFRTTWNSRVPNWEGQRQQEKTFGPELAAVHCVRLHRCWLAGAAELERQPFQEPVGPQPRCAATALLCPRLCFNQLLERDCIPLTKLPPLRGASEKVLLQRTPLAMLPALPMEAVILCVHNMTHWTHS